MITRVLTDCVFLVSLTLLAGAFCSVKWASVSWALGDGASDAYARTVAANVFEMA
jgi:hypothetical protein